MFSNMLISYSMPNLLMHLDKLIRYGRIRMYKLNMITHLHKLHIFDNIFTLIIDDHIMHEHIIYHHLSQGLQHVLEELQNSLGAF